MNFQFANAVPPLPSVRPWTSLPARGMRRVLPIVAAFTALTASGVTVNFGDLSLEEDSYWNGDDESGGFSTGGAAFNNSYNTEWNTWSGWSYSNVIDTETPGHLNQYAAITGSAIAANGIYGIANVDHFTPVFPAIDLPEDTHPVSFTVTNTTYAYYAMRDGDDFAKAFSTEDNDWFRLDIRGLDSEGIQTGSVPFYLADYRFDDPGDAYIIDEWTSVDLTSLGEATRTLEFTLTSSDTGDFGMNTPAYFAMGEMTAVPEPATAGLLAGAGIFGLAVYLRRKRREG